MAEQTIRNKNQGAKSGDKKMSRSEAGKKGAAAQSPEDKQRGGENSHRNQQ